MIEIDTKPRRKSFTPEQDEPFRILLLGDFGAADLSKPTFIDRDNFDEVMEQLKVAVDLPLAGHVTFQNLDQFHPDHLYRRLSMFKALREMRDKLEAPETSESAADYLFAKTPQPTVDILKPSSALDDLVSAETGGASTDPFKDWVRKLVAPYAVKDNPKLPEMLAELDAAISGNMRAVLHHEQFQAVEAAWRAVDFLVRGVDTSVELKFYLMNLPQRFLASDLIESRDLKKTVLQAILGGTDYNLVAGAYTFSDSELDMEVLGRIALIVGHAKTRFVAGAATDIEKWLSPGPAYHEVRAIPEARCVGLAFPRWIQRLPYGKKSSEIDSFEFEEFAAGEPPHAGYCWASAAFACAYLYAQQEAMGQDVLNIHSLPAHVYTLNGEKIIKPCAEILMTQDQAQKLIDQGLMPLLSMKGQDWIRLAGFRAINGENLGG
jgi:type VI secretion system protein ImpC